MIKYLALYSLWTPKQDTPHVYAWYRIHGEDKSQWQQASKQKVVNVKLIAFT